MILGVAHPLNCIITIFIHEFIFAILKKTIICVRDIEENYILCVAYNTSLLNPTESLSLQTLKDMDDDKLLNRKKDADLAIGDMLPETRSLLNDFYQPCNHDLARLLKDDRFLW